MSTPPTLLLGYDPRLPLIHSCLDRQLSDDLQVVCVWCGVRAAPVIVSLPEHKKNVTGSNVAILCEAKGFPIPTVEWTWMRVDGQMVYLPSESIVIRRVWSFLRFSLQSYIQ